MGNKKSPIRKKKKAAKQAAVGSQKPARKTRTKTRKPKYLSLKVELFQQQQKKTKTPPKPLTKIMPPNIKQQLNLFPLRPENPVQDHKLLLDMQDDHQQVALLLETATDTSTSLHSLLDTTTTTAATTTSEDAPLSSSPIINSLCKGNDHDRDDSEEVECGSGSSLLVRTAMRCKERDSCEERWVSYWEVVKKEQEEVSSEDSKSFGYTAAAAADADALGRMVPMQGGEKGSVGLKLDYQEILNAWSDKGSLYIEGEFPQTVPDLYDFSNGSSDGWGSVWRVPEMNGVGAKEESKSRQREASLLRYKEKRQSRLFSKRIRYEVRKLNAEKRPRLKGRFVKRAGET